MIAKKEMVNTLQKFYDDNSLTPKQEHFVLELIKCLGGETLW